MTVNEEIRDALRKVYRSNDPGRNADNKRTRQAANMSQDPTPIPTGVATTTPEHVAEELMSIPLSRDPRMGLCVPLTVANDKDWHEPTLKLAERRANNVFSLVQAMCHIASPKCSVNPKMHCWVRCAKYLEKSFYNNANSRRQYFILVATSIHKLEKKHGWENQKLTRLSSRAGFATENPAQDTRSRVEPFPPMPAPVVRQYRQISRRSSAMLSGKCYPSARHDFPTGVFQPPVGVATGEVPGVGLYAGHAQPSGRGSELAEKLGIGFHCGPIGYQPAICVFPAPPILVMGCAGSQALLQAGGVSSSTAGFRPAFAASVPSDQAAQPPPGGSSQELIVPDSLPVGASSTPGTLRRVGQDSVYDNRDAAAHIDVKPSTKVDESHDESAIGQRLVASRIAQLMVSANSNRETVPKMNRVIKYAGKIENEVYQLAGTKEEYYDCIAERICKVHNKFMGDVQEHQKERVMTKLKIKLASPKVNSRKRSLEKPGKCKENNDNECNEQKSNALDMPDTIDENDESDVMVNEEK